MTINKIIEKQPQNEAKSDGDDLSKQEKYNNEGKINNTSQEFGLMITLQENLNLRIGTERWRKYISSIFWHYVSTPINFTITLFTALSSGQVGTGTNFLSNSSLFGILFTTFLLSTINTFFKLKETTEANYKIAQQFEEFAIKFEHIYYTPINSDRDVYKRYIDYKKLQYDINDYCKTTGIDNVNYLTELMYSCCKYMCFKSKTKLISSSERFWILDGKKKHDTYNKKFVRIDMSNFELDTQKIHEDDLDVLTLDQLKSPNYTHVDNLNHDTHFFRHIFGKNNNTDYSSKYNRSTSHEDSLSSSNNNDPTSISNNINLVVNENEQEFISISTHIKEICV